MSGKWEHVKFVISAIGRVTGGIAEFVLTQDLVVDTAQDQVQELKLVMENLVTKK